MTELQEKFLFPFAPGKMKYSLEQIAAQRAVFLALLQEPPVVEALEKIRVTIHVAASSDDFLRMATPVGEISAKFVSQLEGDHLGVAAVFGCFNDKNRFDSFFVARLNFQTPWIDSTGTELEMTFHSENPTNSAFVRMLLRVFATRLQILETSLTNV